MSDVINGVRESVDDSGEVTNLVASNQTDRDAEKIVKSELSTPRHKYRYDWYQTETDVCINILIKKLKKENVHVVFQENSVSLYLSMCYSTLLHNNMFIIATRSRLILKWMKMTPSILMYPLLTQSM